MGVFYGYIGWQHLVNPSFFLDIMPSIIPYPDAAVLWCQILGFSKAEAALRLFFQIPLLLIARWHAIGLKHGLYSLICSALFFPTVLYFIQL